MPKARRSTPEPQDRSDGTSNSSTDDSSSSSSTEEDESSASAKGAVRSCPDPPERAASPLVPGATRMPKACPQPPRSADREASRGAPSDEQPDRRPAPRPDAPRREADRDYHPEGHRHQPHSSRAAAGTRVALTPRPTAASSLARRDQDLPPPPGGTDSRPPSRHVKKAAKHPKEKDRKKEKAHKQKKRRHRSHSPPAPPRGRPRDYTHAAGEGASAAAAGMGRPAACERDRSKRLGRRSRTQSSRGPSFGPALKPFLTVDQRLIGPWASHCPTDTPAAGVSLLINVGALAHNIRPEYPLDAVDLLRILDDMETQGGSQDQRRRLLVHGFLEEVYAIQWTTLPPAYIRIVGGTAVHGEDSLAFGLLEHPLPRYIADGLHALINSALDNALKLANIAKGQARRLFPFIAAKADPQRRPSREVPQLPTPLQGLLALPRLLGLPHATSLTNIAILVAARHLFL